jgi:hypothetical protein
VCECVEPPLLVQRCNGTSAGLGYLEVNVICPCKSPHWAMDWTVDPHGENGSNPLLTLTLTTITSMQIQNKQASTPHHAHSTMQPPSKITYVKCTRVNISACKNNKSKRAAYATKYLKYLECVGDDMTVYL